MITAIKDGHCNLVGLLLNQAEATLTLKEVEALKEHVHKVGISLEMLYTIKPRYPAAVEDYALLAEHKRASALIWAAMFSNRQEGGAQEIGSLIDRYSGEAMVPAPCHESRC